MHPAKSVIFFTTTTGAGYGLLIWLAVFGALGALPADRLFGFAAFCLAFVLVGSGLLSSTLHLGHPERAWRALSQWRSSWLSREGVAAIVTFVPTGFFGLLWVFGGVNKGAVAWLGVAGAVMSLVTVFCTSMIYVSLKAVPAWHNGWVTPGYLALSLGTGALALAALAAAFGVGSAKPIVIAAFAGLGAGLAIKLAYWASIATAPPVATSGSATGLAKGGSVRLIDAPHTEANYLLEEMGFQIARKHAAKLRWIAILLGFAAPLATLALCLAVAGALGLVLLFAALVSCAIGIAVERWLFFAEARHVVTLYYGERGV